MVVKPARGQGLSRFASESLASRVRLDCSVPRQPTHSFFTSRLNLGLIYGTPFPFPFPFSSKVSLRFLLEPSHDIGLVPSEFIRSHILVTDCVY